MKKQLLIVGGGVLGTMHAWRALKAGYSVTQLERDLVPVSASVRNFGLVWVGGRKAGAELQEALHARELWAELAAENQSFVFRPNGSITIARTQAEWKVMEESMLLPDATERGWKLLNSKEVKEINPALGGNFIGGLHCSLDAAVEPNLALASIRQYLLSRGDYNWIPNTHVVEVADTASGVKVSSNDGRHFEADFAIVCPGADHSTLFGSALEVAPIRKVRLQMMSTAPLDSQVTTSVADGDSLRYYPAYDVPALKELPPQEPVAAQAAMQLLLVQRIDGTLTIGDTHEYQEPFDFAVREPEYEYLAEVAASILGRKLPPIVRRWAGVYSQRTDGAICERQMVGTNVLLVTGPGGRGNSLAPAIAHHSLLEAGLL